MGTPSAPDDSGTDERPALIAAWSAYTTTIRDQKRELWQVANYTLLFLGAIIVAARDSSKLPKVGVLLLASFATVLAVWAIVYLWNGFARIRTFRQTIGELHTALGGQFAQIIGGAAPAATRGWEVPLMQSVAVVVVWAYLIYRLAIA